MDLGRGVQAHTTVNLPLRSNPVQARRQISAADFQSLGSREDKVQPARAKD
jgi:hypothetical protein